MTLLRWTWHAAGAALFLFPFAVVLSGFFQDPALYVAAVVAPAPLYVLGAACRLWGYRRRVWQIVILLAGAAGTATVLYALTGLPSIAVLGLAGSICFLLSGRMNIRATGTPFWAVGISVSLVALFLVSQETAHAVYAYLTATQWAGALFFIFGVFERNAGSVRWGVQPVAAKGDRVKPPKTLFRANVLMTSLFLALSAVITFFDAVRAFLGRVIGEVIFAILWIFALISSLLDATPIQEGGSPSGDGGFELPIAEVAERGTDWFFVVLSVLVFAALGTAIALLIFRVVYNLAQAWPVFWARFMNRFFSGDGGYVDETETLWNFDRAKAQIGGRIRSFTARLRRPARWEDMPDNRMKVRFAYQNMLKKHRSAYKTSHTADDWRETLTGPDAWRFLEAYNRARYHDRPVTDQDAALAHKINDGS